MAASITNPHGKCSLQVKSLNDMTAEERLPPLTSNLIQLPVRDGRRDNTPRHFCPSYQEECHRGGPCTVPVASPLDEATLSELKTILSLAGMAYWLSLDL
ncbi:ATP synthase subunit O, mitochondrial [Myotis brandtii]|uniref:ATP synthase subunit O, mitochondrial n=1 Tax=Myotis brandtii TaxID=109478 RepID=S7NAH4_MYOBR|nr:ATP synthase subunit O, mitochondrial [Myotis brandtii]